MKELKRLMAGVLAVSICASAASVYADSDITTLTLTTSANKSEGDIVSVKNEEEKESSKTIIFEEEEEIEEEIEEEEIE